MLEIWSVPNVLHACAFPNPCRVSTVNSNQNWQSIFHKFVWLSYFFWASQKGQRERWRFLHHHQQDTPFTSSSFNVKKYPRGGDVIANVFRQQCSSGGATFALGCSPLSHTRFCSIMDALTPDGRFRMSANCVTTPYCYAYISSSETEVFVRKRS
jgi:hypothetical protein